MGRRTVDRKIHLVGANGEDLSRTARAEVWGAWEALDPAVVKQELGIGVETCHRNERMMVLGHRQDNNAFLDPEGQPITLWHLALVGTKNHPTLTWGEAQRAKAELLGEDVEAIELYPAADRVFDLPEVHLWCFPRGFKLPLGFAKRVQVVDATARDPEGNPIVREADAVEAPPVPAVTPGVREALRLPEADMEGIGLSPEEAEAQAAAELARMREALKR
jgi:hypothetical protein